LLGPRILGVVGGDPGHVLFPHGEAVELSQGRFEENPDRIRELLHAFEYVESGNRPSAERGLDHLTSPEGISGHFSLSGVGCQCSRAWWRAMSVPAASSPLPPPPLGSASFRRRYRPPASGWGTNPLPPPSAAVPSPNLRLGDYSPTPAF